MLNLKSFLDVFKAPKPDPLIRVSHDYLHDDGLAMGTLFIGRAGTGKTSSLGTILFNYIKRHQQEAVFVIDWSGSITDVLLDLILQDKNYQEILRRVVYDDMGNPEWAVPLPEFASEYGSTEDQVQRVSINLSRLAPELVQRNPTLGGISLGEVAQNFFRVLTAVTNEYDETWQITEAKRLIYDIEVLRKVLRKYGFKVPAAKAYLEKWFLTESNRDRHFMTNAIIAMLGAIEPNDIKARIGYYRPGWTPKEAIEKGLIVIIDGARLINRPSAQYYLFMQVYSLILQEINRRRPANQNDLPITLVLDEVYSLLSIPGMASEISRLSPQYRSRKLQLYIVLQELEQMSRDLRPHIWSLGNIVCFAINNIDEAYEIAQQLFSYDRYAIKIAPVSERTNPIMETDRGQYLERANWIQSLNHRECIIRRYLSEQKREEKIQYVPKTYDIPFNRPYMSVKEAKQMLVEARGVRVHDALLAINQRINVEDNVHTEVPGL